MQRFGRFGLLWVVTSTSTRFLFLPPPTPHRPWVQRSVGLPRSLYFKRSSLCYLLFLLNEPALHVQLCRFLNMSEVRTRMLLCERPMFRFGEQVEQ